MENKIKFKIEMEIEVSQTELEGLYHSSYTQLRSYKERSREGIRLILQPNNGTLVDYAITKFERITMAGESMDFGKALELLKQGKKVAREGWNGKGLWLELQRPDAYSKMTLPYVYMNYPKGDKYHDGCRVPWLASQTDMLEEDWKEVK